MKLLNLVLFAFTYARVTTRNGGKYTQGVNFDADQSIDDYGNVIERDYDGQFYQQNKESVEWKPTGDYEATTMGTTTNEPEESTPEPEVVEPYINSKYDPNGVWLSPTDNDWTPSDDDMIQIQADIELDLSYE